MSEHQEGMPGVVTTSLNILGVFVLLMIVLAVYSMLTFKQAVKTVSINGVGHSVLLSDTATTRYRGLSGKKLDDLGAQGMMFTFPSAEVRTFEMRQMLFPLDFIWVNHGTIVKIDENIPAPKNNEKPAQVSSKPDSVDTVFEFPAGFVSINHLATGQMITK